MITPEYLEYMLNTLEVHKQLQESIIRDIARRMVKNPEIITDTAAWQAEKTQQAGILYDDLIRELSKITGGMEKEISMAFEDAETEIFNYDRTAAVAAGFDPEEFRNLSPAMQRLWTAALSKTSTEAVNLTKTTAVTAQNLYIQACDLAHMQVSSGAFDYNTAIRNAARFAAEQGATVVYPSGWVDKLDTAVRRSVLTGVNQTAGQLQTMRAAELDCDIMEITAHMGARPAHAEWQGKLVSMSGKRGYLSLKDIGYGTVTGFMGANCRHNWFMFFPGISKRNYTDAQLAELNGQTVKYNGEDVPVWKAADYQRRLERAVKQTKRELVAYDEALKNATDAELKEGLKNDFTSSSVRLKKQETRLKDFCKQTGLYYDSSRVQVFSAETERGIRNWGRSTAQKAVAANKRALTKKTENDIIKIHQGRQDKHVLNSNNYIKGRSYVTISNADIKTVIKSKQGTGRVVGNKEHIIADKIIGVNINAKHNFKTLTDTAHIHSSKDGVHLVPTHTQLRSKSVMQLKGYCKKVAMEYYDTPECTKFLGALSEQEKERRINLLLAQKQSKTSLIKDIKAMEKKILKARGDIK